MWLEKLIQISPARIVAICDMHKSNSGFSTSLETLDWEKLTFDQFVSKHQIFSIENCRLDIEKVQRLWEHLETFWSGEEKPSVTDLKQKQLATWLL